MKKIVILGATGSIGRQALDVVRAHPGRWRVAGLAAGRNAALLADQAREFRPEAVALADRQAAADLVRDLAPLGVEVLAGEEGIEALAALPGADLVLSGMAGGAGLVPTCRAVLAGKDVALANKESLVAGGPVIMEAARRLGVRILPVDSEHSGLFQCLEGRAPDGVSRIWLTASGGPFRGWRREDLAGATAAAALRHPTWRMGARITVDSATLMNKGLEVIEAHWLFGVPYERIEVLVHPESIVHALVEMADGSVLAQMSRPDMRLPIQYALSWPERLPGPLEPLDLARAGTLHFERPDRDAFPCLELAYEAGRTGGTLPAVLNGAKEVAVDAFLAGGAGFLDIPRIISAVMDQHSVMGRPGLEDILAADAWARRQAAALLGRRSDAAAGGGRGAVERV